MQNLVSKNPIQRFKQGKKILKAQWGKDLSDKRSTDYNGPIDLSGRELALYKLKRDGYIKNGKYTNPTQQRIIQQPVVATKPQKTNNSFYQFGKIGGWKRSIGESIIDDQESLRMLKEMGMEKYSAGQVQDEINKQFGSNAVKRDNKWGNQSKAGLKGLYENWKLQNPNSIVPIPESATLKTDEYYQSQKPSNQPSVLPKIEMPYTSTGTYNLDNSRTLKTLGIKDYNSLLNFIEKNPGSAIASDLKQRFGETSGWNQQNIENEIGIGGHYGRMNRNAFWGYLSGLKSKYNQDYARKLGMMMLGYNKQGGQLISRNPIVRFKNKKK